MSPFNKETKILINERQNHECAMCGHRVKNMPPHHIVPENALRPIGVRGLNVEGNGVAFCSGEWGRGENSPDDCHEIADRKAIDEHKFWKNGRFVDLSELDPTTYVVCHNEMPKCRKKNKSKRHKHHRR